jgi:hypothetical protein
MDRTLTLNAKPAGEAAFELSEPQRRHVADRLRRLHERWMQRLETAASGERLTGAELQNLYDNLTFAVDHVSDGPADATSEAIIAKLEAALEEAGGEETVSPEMLPRYREIVELTDSFCRERLNDEYRLLCRHAAAGLCQDGSPVKRGKVAGWASGVVATVGWVNHLTDPSQTPHIRSEEIAKWFGVSVATMHSKSKTLREGLELVPFDPHLTLPSRLADNPLLMLGNMLTALPMDEPQDGARKGAHPIAADEDYAFQLKITLKNVKPSVWRRVQTLDCTLDELHETIQAVMGWEDCHLHEFRVGKKRFVAEEGEDSYEPFADSRSETDVLLSDLYFAGEKKIDYTYDFGDDWEHRIEIEKALSPADVGDDPLCTDGAGACPPEDVGGPWGYAGFLAALADPQHEQHAELQEWFGEEFDPKHFDVQEVNRLLAR